MSIFFQKKPENLWIYGVGGGLCEVAYCFFIAVLLNFLNNYIVGMGQVFGFMLALIILVFSVAVSGLLIFSYPIYLAIKKFYVEAVTTAMMSIATLIITGFLVILIKTLF
jgi:hypothetical protein